MDDYVKYDLARKRLSNISLVSSYYYLLSSNIDNCHFEKYMRNEEKWFDFLGESIRINELILPVLLFGNFNSVYQDIKNIYGEIETNETIINSIGVKEIHILNCCSRFISLCDMMKRFGEFDIICNKIIKYKKRTFYGLKVGDTVYIKVKRNISEKYHGFTIRRKFYERIKSRVIYVQNENKKIQVEYGKRWFSLDDYPGIVTTTKEDDFYKVDKSIWDIEHGKDELFNLVERKVR